MCLWFQILFQGKYNNQRDRAWVLAAVMHRAVWAEVGQEDQVLRTLREYGITHLIVDRCSPSFPKEWDQFAIIGPAARAGWYDLLYQDGYYVLYRIRREALNMQLSGAQS